MIGDGALGDLDKGGGKVDRLDQRVTGGAAGRVRRRARIGDDQRHFDGRLVEQVLLAQPVVAQIIAMVRGQHDHRVICLSGGVQVIQDASQMIVALLDQPHIGGNHLLTHLILLEGCGDLVVHERVKHGLRIFAFRVGSHRRRHIVRPEHVVIGRGHDVRPVRFDIADMRAPRPLGLIHEAQGFTGQPRGLTVFLADIGGFIGIVEHPAAGDLAILDARIGIYGPRVFSRVTLRLQVRVVGRVLFVIEPVWPLGPQPVVTDPDVKAAFGLTCADDAVGRDAKAFHALGVHLHMRLAQKPAVHSGLAQVIAHCVFAHAQREAVPLRAVGRGIAPGIGAHPAGATDRRLHITVGKPHAARRHAIKVWRLQRRMAGAAEVIEPKLIIHDEKNVHGCPSTGVFRTVGQGTPISNGRSDLAAL